MNGISAWVIVAILLIDALAIYGVVMLLDGAQQVFSTSRCLRKDSVQYHIEHEKAWRKLEYSGFIGTAASFATAKMLESVWALAPMFVCMALLIVGGALAEQNKRTRFRVDLPPREQQ